MGFNVLTGMNVKIGAAISAIIAIIIFSTKKVGNVMDRFT